MSAAEKWTGIVDHANHSATVRPALSLKRRKNRESRLADGAFVIDLTWYPQNIHFLSLDAKVIRMDRFIPL